MADAWYVLVTMPNTEASVERGCEQRGIRCYSPKGRRVMPGARGREPKSVLRHVFPGYVMVLIEGDPGDFPLDRDPLTQPAVWGARDFLRFHDTGAPQTLEDAIIDDMREREKRGEFDEVVPLQKWFIPRWLRKAKRLEIVGGPFAGRFGRIMRIVNARRGCVTVRIWVQEKHGAGYPIDCPLDWLARAS